MKKYSAKLARGLSIKAYAVKFAREFDVEIEADNLELAEQHAFRVIAQFPPESCKLLSVIEKRGSDRLRNRRRNCQIESTTNRGRDRVHGA